jgi:hypothetical protein
MEFKMKSGDVGVAEWKQQSLELVQLGVPTQAHVYIVRNGGTEQDATVGVAYDDFKQACRYAYDSAHAADAEFLVVDGRNLEALSVLLLRTIEAEPEWFEELYLRVVRLCNPSL